MSDREITLYNCNPDDVFEVKASVFSYKPVINRMFTVGILSHVPTYGFAASDIKRLIVTNYDLERDVYTVECK